MKGLALAALIVGIGAFLIGLIPVVGALVGLAAVVLGVLALRKRQPKAWALAGVVLGGVAMVASIAMTIGIASLASNSANEYSETEYAEPVEPAAPLGPKTDPTDEAAVDPEAVPAEYATALEAAEIYANRMDMSKAGIYDQLTSEFGEDLSPESAQYAVDTVQADWEANALATAKMYRDDLSVAPTAIHEQLTTKYGGQFTVDEADYAMEHLDD